MNRAVLTDYLNKTYAGFSQSETPQGVPFYSGKVRDVFTLEKELLIITTDRVSAFDRVLSTIPCKGEVLNQLSLFWFNKTQDIIANHIIEQVTPRTVRTLRCEVLPIEVIVRGYLTGSAWRDYQKGNPISSIVLPPGMRMSQKFEKPLLTPSTKEAQGKHDQPISCSQIVSTGLVSQKLWSQIEEAALGLFQRGTQIAAQAGMLLVDTKYEFGVCGNKLYLIDEIHTPDSSRYWYAKTYEELFTKNEPQKEFDKEYLRQWLINQGFMGDGKIPEIPGDVRIELAWKYIQLFGTITGKDFSPNPVDPEAEKQSILSYLVSSRNS